MDLVGIAADALQVSNPTYTREYLLRNVGLFVSQEPYYSTGYFTATSNALAQGLQVPLFQVPQGQIGQGLPTTVNTGLSYADTNVEVQDMFPDGQAFIAVAATIDVFAANVENITGAGYSVVRSFLDASTSSNKFAADGSATEVDIKALQTSVMWRWEKIGMPQDRLGFAENFPCANGPSGYGGAVGGTGALTAAAQFVAATSGGSPTAASASVGAGTIGGIARGVARNGGPFTVPTSFQIPIMIKPKQAIKSTLTIERPIANLSQAAALYGFKVQLIGLRFNLAGE
jgi:hypothetical protein